MFHLVEGNDWTEVIIEWLETSMQILLRSFTGATSSLETNQNNIWNVIESIWRFGRIGVDVVTAEQIGTFSCNFAGDFCGLLGAYYYQTGQQSCISILNWNQNNVSCRITNESNTKKSLSLISGVFKPQRAKTVDKTMFWKHQKHVQVTRRSQSMCSLCRFSS